MDFLGLNCTVRMERTKEKWLKCEMHGKGKTGIYEVETFQITSSNELKQYVLVHAHHFDDSHCVRFYNAFQNIKILARLKTGGTALMLLNKPELRF